MRNITITDKTTINPDDSYEFQYRFVFPTNTAVLTSTQYAEISSAISTGSTNIETCGYSWVEFILTSKSNNTSKVSGSMLFTPADYERTYHSFILNQDFFEKLQETPEFFIGMTCKCQICIHIKYANGSSEDIWSENTDFNVECTPTCELSFQYKDRYTISGTISVKSNSKEVSGISESYVSLEQNGEIIYHEQFYAKRFEITDIDMSNGNTTPIYLYVEGVTELGSKFESPKKQIGYEAGNQSINDISMNCEMKNDSCITYTITGANLNEYEKFRLLRYTVIYSKESSNSILCTVYQNPMTFETNINTNTITFDDYTIQDNERYVYSAFVYDGEKWLYINKFFQNVININMRAETLCDKDKNIVYIFNSSSTTTDSESDIVINQPIESRFPKVTQTTRKHHRTGSTTGVIRSMTHCDDDAAISQDVHSIYRWLLEQKRKMTPFLLKTLHGNMIVIITKISSAIFEDTDCLQITFEWTEIANANSIIDLYTFGFSDFQLDSHWKKKNIEDITTSFGILK